MHKNIQRFFVSFLLLVCAPVHVVALQDDTIREISAHVAGFAIEEGLNYVVPMPYPVINKIMAGLVLKAASTPASFGLMNPLDSKSQIVVNKDGNAKLEWAVLETLNKGLKIINQDIAEQVANGAEDFNGCSPEVLNKIEEAMKNNGSLPGRTTNFIATGMLTPIAVDQVKEQFHCSKATSRFIVGTSSVLLGYITLNSIAPGSPAALTLIGSAACQGGISCLGGLAGEGAINYYKNPQQAQKDLDLFVADLQNIGQQVGQSVYEWHLEGVAQGEKEREARRLAEEKEFLKCRAAQVQLYNDCRSLLGYGV
jgi:hypothetical protein